MGAYDQNLYVYDSPKNENIIIKRKNNPTS